MTTLLTVELRVALDRRSRYPRGTIRMLSGDHMQFLDSAEIERPSDIIIVDRPIGGEREALAEARCAAISVSSLATLVSRGWVRADSDLQWVPLTPLLAAPEIAIARRWANGELGGIRFVDLVTPFGILPQRAWDEDAAGAADEHEALVYGMQLIETLAGHQIGETGVICETVDLRVYCHRLQSGVTITHRVVPRHYLRSPGYRAEIYCSRGRLLLRNEFTVGAVGIAPDGSNVMSFPALPQSRSVQGGWEVAAVLQRSATAAADNDELRSQVLRLTGRVLELVGPPERGAGC